VYSIDVCQPGTVIAAVPEYPDRDPDIALLSAPDQNACLDRAHTELTADVEPGRYWLVVDTYVDTPVELDGPYSLDVDFDPTPGTEGCAAHLTCDQGECVCADPKTIDCDGACIDPSSDPANCGACGNACAADETCVMGACEAESSGGGSGGPSQHADPTDPAPPDEAGCACTTTKPRSHRPWQWLLAAALLAFGRRRRALSAR
jgi:MYXO-CTERM domain-containing protein